MRMMIPADSSTTAEASGEEIFRAGKKIRTVPVMGQEKPPVGKYTSMYGSYEEEKELKAIFEKNLRPCEIEEI